MYVSCPPLCKQQQWLGWNKETNKKLTGVSGPQTLLAVQIELLLDWQFNFYFIFFSFFCLPFIFLSFNVSELLTCVCCACRTQHDGMALRCLYSLYRIAMQQRTLGVLDVDEQKERFNVKNTHSQYISECMCRRFMTTELASLKDEESARTRGVLVCRRVERTA